MTTVSADTTLGQLVADHPGLARVLDRHGLDYCCGGRTSLGQACARKGLDVDAVVRELAAEGSGDSRVDRFDDSAEAPLGRLIDQIVTIHHDYLRRELPRLSALATKVAEAHGSRHPELGEVRRIFGNLKAELEDHTLKEERVLFPMIKELEASTTMPRLHCGSINNPIDVMEHEHADAGAALQRMRELTGGYEPPDDACPSYRALLYGLADLELDLHRHIHKENSILFPRASLLESALQGA